MSVSARQPLLLAAVALGQFMAAGDYNIVYVALPRIGTQMHLDAHNLQWVVSAFAVAYGGLLLFGGRATDTLGRSRVFRAALLVFGLGSALSGIAPASGWLIAGRAAQGLAAALMTPAMLAIVHSDFEEGTPRNRALAAWSSAGAVGLATGSLLGGVLTQALGWRSIFAVNVLFVLVTLALSSRAMPGSARGGKTANLGGLSALAATGSIGALVYALVEGPAAGWGSAQFIVALVLAFVLGGAFVITERRSDDPLLPARLLGNRPLRATTGAAFAFMASFGTEYYLFTVYFQDVRHYDVLTAGLAFLPAPVIGFGSTQFAGRLLGRLGAPATLLLGLFSGAAGMVAIAAGTGVSFPYAALLPGIALLSVGQGLSFTALFAAAGTGVEPAQQGIAAALASTALQIGSAVGLAILVAVANAPVHVPGAANQMVTGLRDAGYCAAAIALAGAAVSARLLWRQHTQHEPVTSGAGQSR